MAWRVKDGATLRTITSLTVLDGSIPRVALRAKVMDSGGTLRTIATFASPITAITISPDGGSYESYSRDQTSDTLTALPTNGVGPFTYAWSVVSGGGFADSPTASATTISSGILAIGEVRTITVRCTVTDSTGATAQDDATVTFTCTNPYVYYTY